MERLGDFVTGCGDEAMVADDMNTYKPVVERLGLERRIRVVRVKKRARKRLDQDRRLGLGQGEDMAAADGAAAGRRLGARGSGQRRALRRMRVELSGKWRALLRRRRRRGVPYGQGVQERRRHAERVWADSVGLERSRRLGHVGAGLGAAL